MAARTVAAAAHSRKTYVPVARPSVRREDRAMKKLLLIPAALLAALAIAAVAQASIERYGFPLKGSAETFVVARMTFVRLKLAALTAVAGVTAKRRVAITPVESGVLLSEMFKLACEESPPGSVTVSVTM